LKQKSLLTVPSAFVIPETVISALLLGRGAETGGDVLSHAG